MEVGNIGEKISLFFGKFPGRQFFGLAKTAEN